MKKRLVLMLCLSVILAISYVLQDKKSKLPLIAIANYGPHLSLSESIEGFKEELAGEGFVENKTVRYEMRDAGFDPVVIPQMISSLKASQPKLMLVMTTPVAQVAKGKVHDIPLIFNVITDPVAAGLIHSPFQADNNMSGSSDKQDLHAFIQFAKSILPEIKRIGLLYATSEANDQALLQMMKRETERSGIQLLAIPVEQARDVSLRVQQFKNRVDLIYVGTSGPIQPSLPAIAASARKMNIPVFNVESSAVKQGLALASYGVNYRAVGRNAGKLAVEVLRGKNIREPTPIYPDVGDHKGLVNAKRARELGLIIPSDIKKAGER